MDLNDPVALRLFARGLPNPLADACIDLDGPESFEQWRNAAQRQHRAWLKKQAIHRDYNKPPTPKPQVPNQGRWQGLWNTGEEEECKLLAPNSREEIPMQWIPQQARPQLRNRKRNSARKDAAMNAKGKAIWQGTAPPRNLRPAVRNL